jgi:hypothetical protein
MAGLPSSSQKRHPAKTGFPAPDCKARSQAGNLVRDKPLGLLMVSGIGCFYMRQADKIIDAHIIVLGEHDNKTKGYFPFFPFIF